MKAMLLLIAGLLAGCQSWPRSASDQRPPPHRGVGASAGWSGAAGSGTASGGGDAAPPAPNPRAHGMGKDNWYGMCELNQRIMAAPTPEQRQALVEQAMPNMSQESRERHLQMMRERCRR